MRHSLQNRFSSISTKLLFNFFVNEENVLGRLFFDGTNEWINFKRDSFACSDRENLLENADIKAQASFTVISDPP
jgi:hypothetical protein